MIDPKTCDHDYKEMSRGSVSMSTYTCIKCGDRVNNKEYIGYLERKLQGIDPITKVINDIKAVQKAVVSNRHPIHDIIYRMLEEQHYVVKETVVETNDQIDRATTFPTQVTIFIDLVLKK